MKKLILLSTVLASAMTCLGQGGFIYDQQSSDESNVLLGGTGIFTAPAGSGTINSPGQSFTPQLSSVGFIRLYISDQEATDLLGASFLVNVRADSITGTILGTSSTVALPNSTVAPVNFFFGTPVSVTPGTTYFFDVIKLSGPNTWDANMSIYNYSGGIAYTAEQPDINGTDLWFRSGIVVPEPSALSLLLLGAGLLVRFGKRRIA